MKLNSRNVFPENNTMHFVVNDLVRQPTFLTRGKIERGYVGIALFIDGKWYSMPGKEEITADNNFYWVEI